MQSEPGMPPSMISGDKYARPTTPEYSADYLSQIISFCAQAEGAVSSRGDRERRLRFINWRRGGPPSVAVAGDTAVPARRAGHVC